MRLSLHWFLLSLDNGISFEFLSFQLILLFQLIVSHDLDLLKFLLKFWVYLQDPWQTRIIFQLLTVLLVIHRAFAKNLLLNLLLS